ncbi:MAG: YIP1 family protein [Pseudomonadota bacterium]
MEFNLSFLVALAWETVQNPRDGAERVLGLGIPSQALLPSATLVVVLTALTVAAHSLLQPPSPEAIEAGIVLTPFMLAGLVGANLIVVAGLIQLSGKILGGEGTFPEAFLLVTWWLFIQLCLQVVLLPVAIAVPFLSGLLEIGVLVLTIWLLFAFTAVLHRFKSIGQAAISIVIGFLGLAFATGMLLAIMGISFEGVATGA